MKLALIVALTSAFNSAEAWLSHVRTSSRCSSRFRRQQQQLICRSSNGNDEEEEWSDFDDLGFAGNSGNSDRSKRGNEDGGTISRKLPSFEMTDEDRIDETVEQPIATNFAALLQERNGGAVDLTAIQTRQFLLGQDLILSDYVGNMGFDEVTDWEYYYQSEDEQDRQVVQPNPFDSSKPRRTRASSGSVVRIFRGEFVGQLGGVLSSQGLDRRVLIKEFTGGTLARAEIASIGRLQSDLMEDAKDGHWIQIAACRSVKLRQDNANVAQLVQSLAKAAPILGILGEVNLAELEGNMEPNEFYRSLGVPPPKPDAVWLVYEYAGLSTVQAYAVPAQVRRARLPRQKGFFGSIVEPRQLPMWRERAKYVKAIMKGAILAVASIHESGVVHRSIGRTSIIISTKVMDKREAISPFNTLTSNLRIKLADFGFSGLYEQSTMDDEFCTRARSFGLMLVKGDNTIASTNFAIAEDMHALGFVFLGLLLTSLAELPSPEYQMPATDEDTLQRLLGEIFDKDFDQFREYVEAEDIWSNLVNFLDENDRAGWRVLETLVLAREKAAGNKDTSQIFTVRGLLANPFFSSS